jgi:hypothetical protein
MGESSTATLELASKRILTDYPLTLDAETGLRYVLPLQQVNAAGTAAGF